MDMLFTYFDGPSRRCAPSTFAVLPGLKALLAGVAQTATVSISIIDYLDEMRAEPFDTFTCSPASASVYQFRDYVADRKKLMALAVTP
jgi:hypothetical protein